MSLLVMTMPSATAACFAASGASSRLCRPLTASTSVTTQSRRYCALSIPSVCSVQHRHPVGKTRGLDEDALAVDHFARAPLDEKLAHRFLHVGAHRAPQAP